MIAPPLMNPSDFGPGFYVSPSLTGAVRHALLRIRQQELDEVGDDDWVDFAVLEYEMPSDDEIAAFRTETCHRSDLTNEEWTWNVLWHRRGLWHTRRDARVNFNVFFPEQIHSRFNVRSETRCVTSGAISSGIGQAFHLDDADGVTALGNLCRRSASGTQHKFKCRHATDALQQNYRDTHVFFIKKGDIQTLLNHLAPRRRR
mmetsp:Transcript_2536/g.8093  ORF Transcript_2536/g.8093 Transcript_2536/m.8093 type:complete len:202 (+) Transcript_2536:14-619(+)